MKSPQVIQQLKKHQSLCREKFLLRRQIARRTEKKSCRAVRHRCSEISAQVSLQKPSDASCNHSAAFTVSSTIPNTAVQPVHPVIKSTAANSATDTSYSFANDIWSKSDSAFTSFTNVLNSQNAT